MAGVSERLDQKKFAKILKKYNISFAKVTKPYNVSVAKVRFASEQQREEALKIINETRLGGEIGSFRIQTSQKNGSDSSFSRRKRTQEDPTENDANASPPAKRMKTETQKSAADAIAPWHSYDFLSFLFFLFTDYCAVSPMRNKSFANACT